MADRKLKIIIDQDGNAGPGLLKLKSGLSSLGSVAGGIATSGLLLAAGGIVALGAGITSSIGAAMEAQDGLAELEAVIASTGGVAGVTAEYAQELASSFQDVTRFSDDAILAGENMLLTFTNIGRDVFPEATEAMLNLAEKMNTDPVNAAMQLGKALNDPIDGVTALRKVGVALTDQQEEMIRTMMASGNIAGAQTVLINELETEFGGLAVAAGGTAAGGIDILKNKLGDVQERIGGTFLPLVDQLVGKFSEGLDSTAFQAGLTATTAVIGDLVNVIIPLTEGDTMAALHNFQVALAGLGVDPQQIAGITELLTGDIFGSMVETPSGMAQTGGLLRRMGMSDEDVASAQHSLNTISREAEQISEAFSKIFAAGTGEGAEGANLLVGTLKEIAWAMEKIAAAGDVAAQIRAIFEAVGAGSATNALIKEGTGFDIAGADQFLKSDQMSRQGLMNAGGAGMLANVATGGLAGVGQGMGFDVNALANALSASITSALQTAPPPVTNVAVSLDSAPIAATVSQSIGARVQQIRRAGAAGNF